jgi:hypothetical protein
MVGSYTNRDASDPVIPWTNIEEAHRAYDMASLLHSTDYGRIRETALEWEKAMYSHFEDELFWHPEEIRADAAKDGLLTQAIMGERENAKLKRLVAELSLEKQILKDVAGGNF